MAVEKLIISDWSFKYLSLQRGGIQSLADARGAWETACNDQLRTTLSHIAPHVPRPAGTETVAVLDVGSGLGAIDVLLAKHCAAQQIHAKFTLLDGVHDEPEMRLHRETFNHMGAARQFWRDNDVGESLRSYIDPRHLLETPFPPWPPAGAAPLHTGFDLVLSLGSWCFHYPPARYLQFVDDRLNLGATLILDVRRNHPEWLAQLRGAFGVPRLLFESRKFQRFLFETSARGG